MRLSTKKNKNIFFLLLGLISLSPQLQANGFMDKFIDPQDGNFDTSEWLLEDRMFLPVPIIITEPAVGFGFGLGLVFFHETNKPVVDETGDNKSRKKKQHPPSASAVFGGATENGTWFAGGGHQGSYKSDTIRYTGALVYPSVNLKFFGGGDTPVLNQGVEYNMEGWLLIQELKVRIGTSNFLLGPRLTYFDATNTFKLPSFIPVDSIDLKTENLGIGLVATYDSRDNIFSPQTGWQIDLSAMAHSASSLFEHEYNYFNFHPRSYWQLNNTWGLGWRLQAEFTSGDVPFYALPDITLRGIPAMRYQGNESYVTEAQVDYKISPRWTVLAFSGVGTTNSDIARFDSDKNYWAGGLGFRYLTARKLGLNTGIDIARGPEETAIYIQVGSAWNY